MQTGDRPMSTPPEDEASAGTSPPERPKVTAVIPTHAARGTLVSTLASVLAQEGVDMSVIIIDDGFSEENGRFLAALDDPRVTVLHATGGASQSRNCGALHATTEFVAFVDDDDVWAPTKIAEQIAAIRAEPGARWCYCGSVSFVERHRAGEEPSLELVHHQPAPDPDTVTTELFRGNCIPGGGSSTVCDRILLLQIGGFSPMVPGSEDWEMWMRLAAAAPAASVDRPLVGYRVWESQSASVSSNAAKMERSWRRVVNLHASEAARSGVSADRAGYQAYLAQVAARNGNRWEAATRNARAALGIPRRLLWVLPTLIAPRASGRFAARRAARKIPASWRAEVGGWLSQAVLEPAASQSAPGHPLAPADPLEP
jgi:glycosyltransferase involved in cell wall biosynthesis